MSSVRRNGVGASAATVASTRIPRLKAKARRAISPSKVREAERCWGVQLRPAAPEREARRVTSTTSKSNPAS